MRYDSSHNRPISVASIQQINDGLLVMKHFFELNHKLLPIYFELNLRKNKSSHDLTDISKINRVFDAYKFDSRASKVLLDSEILDYIQNAYATIQNEQHSIQNKQDALNLFLSEYHKLKKNWQQVESN